MTISGNGIEVETGVRNRGILYVVATPIGNLKDVTVRALEVLKSVDTILCEDTRRTLQLLTHYGIQKPLLSVFGPKEKRETPRILQILSCGQSLALVSDAGTPALSDPGSFIVRTVRESGYRVEPIPGASSLTCALSVVGLKSDGFVFLGFLQRRKIRIEKELVKAASLGYAVIFFESPYRLVKTLEVAQGVLGKETFCWVGRELTKKFEEIIEGSLGEVLNKIQGKEILGELTVILNTNQSQLKDEN